jgi:hypothetical protein
MTLQEMIKDTGAMEKVYTTSAFINLTDLDLANAASIDTLKQIKANAIDMELTATFQFTENDLANQKRLELFHALGGVRDEDKEDILDDDELMAE